MALYTRQRRKRRAHGPIANTMLNVYTAAWIGRGLIRMRRGRAPWQRGAVVRLGRR